MEKKIILILILNGKEMDIEVPSDLTANELMYGLAVGFLHLEKRGYLDQFYLCTENPIALLRGECTLEQFGLHDGTKVFIRGRK